MVIWMLVEQPVDMEIHNVGEGGIGRVVQE